MGEAAVHIRIGAQKAIDREATDDCQQQGAAADIPHPP
jgi:hypothetical protein